MDKLALETVQQIFEHACTDGGYTGCSLSLTSKSIRIAARSVRFHSIALTARNHSVRAFLRLYEKECSDPSGARPKLVNLYLSGLREDTVDSPSDVANEGRDDEDGEDTSLPNQTVLTATRRLFQLVGDDLQSLVLHDAFVNPDYPLADGPFPSLREPTFLQHDDPCALVAPDSSVSPLFPALTRLHIVDSRDALRSKPLIPSWATHAPHLTYLRISAHNLFGAFLDELPDALGAPAYPFKRGYLKAVFGPPPAKRSYPSLTRVVVQPGPKPSSGPCGTSRFVFNSKSAQLDWIAREATQAGVEMFALSPCEWSNRRWDEEIFTEWVKMVSGDAGRDWFRGEETSEDDVKSRSEP